MKGRSIKCSCFCGRWLSIWLPPTVHCDHCGAIFTWPNGSIPQCLHAPEGQEDKIGWCAAYEVTPARESGSDSEDDPDTIGY